MANKDRNKRSARKARAEGRVQRAEAQVASGAAPDIETALAKAEAAKDAGKPVSPKKAGFFGRIKNYLLDVRTELKRVTWPSAGERNSYTVAVVIMLAIFGVVIWAVDTGIVALLVGFTGLRG
ncbi:preprotein translocase subunit SecE [Coriobacteriales bacterium OH1046]|nr:preprotein translocase subunit SecE [Coriobacteriales bacterium OH1046]